MTTEPMTASPAIDYAKEYDNSGRVPAANSLIENYVIDAAIYREQRTDFADFDKRYGNGERNRLDIFWPEGEQGAPNEGTKDKEAPIVMFIHGGYWQKLDKSSFSHMASGLNACGIAVAIPSYTLCPQNSVDGIINEMRRACILLYQTYKRSIVTVGHSAGGHLSACMMATDWSAIHPDLPDDLVAAGMGISGLYELSPLLHTPINDALGLNEESAKTASPIHWVPDGLNRFEAWVGEDESSEFHRQSSDLAHRWSMMATPTNYVGVESKNHFTVIDPLTRATSEMVRCIVDLVYQPEQIVELPQPSKRAIARATQKFERYPKNIGKTIFSQEEVDQDAQSDEGEANVAEEVQS